MPWWQMWEGLKMAKFPGSIDSGSINLLLQKRHRDDLFVPECYTGPQGTHRLDGWAMMKSWFNQLFIGYEIKMSIYDFRNDKKWHNYLPYTNEFYFVCPSGLIQPSEVGEHAGLIWVSKTGTRLYIKKKAPYREHDQECVSAIWQHILTSRVPTSAISSGAHYINTKETRTRRWEQYCAARQWRDEIGVRVNGRIATLINEATSERDRAKHNLDKVKDWIKKLEELGLVDDNGLIDRTWSTAGRQVLQALGMAPDKFTKLLLEVQVKAGELRVLSDKLPIVKDES